MESIQWFLLGVLSTCPGGDCGASHSDDRTPCFPLRVDILRPADGAMAGWAPPTVSGYPRTHGVGD